MRFQRFSSVGTLAVVCLATTMLMLDIAVVNTALPKIAADPHSGLTGIQWLVPAAAALGHGSSEAYVAGMHTALLVGAALAAAGALASASLLTGLRNQTPTGELAPDPA
jgi:hypothetical protein